MATDHSSAAAASTGETWDEIEGLVEEIARSCRTDLSAQQFYADLLDRAVRALAAEGGAVWLRGDEGGWRIECQINAAAAGLGQNADVDRGHAQLLAGVAEGRQTKLFPPQSGPGAGIPGGGISSGARNSAGGPIANPTDFLLVTAPLRTDGEAFGVLEIFQRPGGSPAAQRGYLQLVEVLAELAADFQRNLELRELRGRASLWTQLDEFSRRVHGSLDLDRVAYTIANEARRLLDCDRVSLAVMRGRRLQLRAVSGCDEVDRRANSMRLLEQFLQKAVALGRPLWCEGRTEELPPQIEDALELYRDESHARSLAILPLTLEPDAEQAETPAGADRSGETVGALVVEQFETGRSSRSKRHVAELVARHSAAALSGALTYHNLPLMPVMRAVGNLRWFARRPQMPVLAAIGVLLVGVALALIVVPAELQIAGRGELQPEQRRIVFAPSDGVVERLFVSPPATGEADDASTRVVRVTRDQKLVELRNSELDYELTRVQGERQTAEKQLITVQVTRRATAPTSPESRDRANELTAREEELKVQLESLDQQLAVLHRRQEQLVVRSPIAGEVLTWDAADLLASRPVRRGQALLTVADVSRAWVLELRVPDHHAGHVLRAWEQQGKALAVHFKLKSDPAVTHYGTVTKVSPATELDDDRQASLLLTVALDAKQLEELKSMSELRPGTTVVANVQCGTRSIGYVWLHDLIDAARTWIMF